METKTTFTLRPPADDDLPRLVEIVSDAARRRGLEPTVTEDELRVEWTRPGFDRERHERVAEVDGLIVGRAGVGLSEVAVSGQAYGGGVVEPEYRGRGIGTALLRWAVDAACREPAATEFRTSVNGREPESVGLVESMGFEYIRTFYRMLHRDPASVEAAQFPDGVRVDDSLRGEALLDALVAAHDASFIDHWNFHPAPREQFAHVFSYDGVEGELAFVAFGPQGDVAGYNWCFLDRGPGVLRGVVGQLGTSRPYRGIGLGRALLRHGVRALAARGATEVELGVDAENPSGALGLYERTGFERVAEDPVYRLPLRPARTAPDP